MVQIYSIGGGKGGVGKSFISVNLGALLAIQGKKVVLIDLDLGSSNLHTFLGLREPKVGLSSFLNKTVNRLEDSALDTCIDGLSVICSLNSSYASANLLHAQKLKIIRAIKNLPFDYVFLDLGAGTHINTIDFFLVSNEGFFVFTPEPTSIENTLRFIKTVYYRKLKSILTQKPFNDIVKELNQKSESGVVKLDDILYLVHSQNPDRGRLLQMELEKFKFRFVLNCLHKQVNPALGSNIEKVCNRHFYSKFQFLGNVSYDDRVYQSICSKKIFVQKYPYTPAVTDLKLIVKRLTDEDSDLPHLRGYNEKI
ncbi:MAG: AAA family ATPase [Deltaproteobacteria bacterium]|uniref:MinD/ParA family ATP-binding protein n=1 Tax=Desulfobacula sp. TaxID=2593537 RepID=UPI001993B5CB|nr:AAA family ATPase [Candidatus Desulfobacula maris]MBL6996044.1 AAA family ATPase [Desulfobacula sp.]